MKLLRFKRIASTNTKAYLLAQQGAAEWTVVVSEVQTKGRGRGGKSWESPRGGLWFSVILRPVIKASKAGLLQILAAVGTREAIEKETGEKIRVKWPNDLVLDDGKLGGILVETKIVKGAVSFAIVGIGVNVNQAERSLPQGAVSLYSITSRKVGVGRLLTGIIESLESRCLELENPSRLLSEWWENCVHREKRVQVEGPKDVLNGISKGIDENGQLLLETTPGAPVKISQGTLTVQG